MFILKENDHQETQVPDLETLREWIRTARVNKSTLVRRASGGDWMTAGELPELSGSFSTGAPPALPSSPLPPDSRAAFHPTLRTSRLAIASLVLGLLSVVSLGITGIAGLICGILARREIRKKPGELKGQGMALAGIIVSGVFLAMLPLIAVVAGLTLPALAKAKQRAQIISCVNQMKQLSLGVRLYSNDHNDQFPMDLRSVSNEVISAKMLICPGDDRPEVDRATITWDQGSPDRISYDYLAPGANESKLGPNAVILRCVIHGTEALADGSVHQRTAQHRR